MTEADDNVVDLRDLDEAFEQVLAGVAAPADAPAWRTDLARLVDGARQRPSDDELAGEADIVAAMVGLREAALAGDLDDDLDDDLAVPVPGPTPVGAAPPGRAAAGVTPVAGAPATGVRPAGAADGTGRAPAGAATPSRPHSPRHINGAAYRARHAAPQPAGSPTARQVGKVLALKAAAVTTAVIVGTVAAAAATTGIVATVVVPAIAGKVTSDKASTAATAIVDDREDASGSGSGRDGSDDVTATSPSCMGMVLVCSPLTPAGTPAPTTPTPSSGTAPSAPAKAGASTTTSTTSPDPEATTTTTTVVAEEPPPVTEPEPTTTTTTTVPEDPPPTVPDPVTPFSAPDATSAAP